MTPEEEQNAFHWMEQQQNIHVQNIKDKHENTRIAKLQAQENKWKHKKKTK